MNEQGDVTWISNSGTGAATNAIFVYTAADGVVSKLSNDTDTNYWPQVNALGEVIWAAWNEADAIYHIYKAVPNATSDPVAQCEIQALPDNKVGVALNNNGDVLIRGGLSGLIWNNGETVATVAVPGVSSPLYMIDINDNRQVIVNSSIDGVQTGYLWENGSVQQIGTPGVITYVKSINNQGQVAGYYSVNYRNYAMIWSNGEMIDLGAGQATDINNAGEASGFFNGLNGKWNNGEVVPYGTLPGFMFFYAPPAINDNGQMTAMAFSYFPNYSMVITMSDNGNVTNLGALNNLYTVPTAINNNGTIVGSAWGDGSSHLVVINDGVLGELTDLLPENSGWSTLERPVDINESGQVLGSGTKTDGSFGYFLMSGCL
jgi:probable HAF family extracellular repeat protein